MQVLIRTAQVIRALGKKKSSLYLDIKNGLFPKPVKIGVRSSAWPEEEVAAINAARIAGKSSDDIRALVSALHARRAGGA